MNPGENRAWWRSPALLWSLAVLAAIVLGSAVTPEAPIGPAGRALPRLPGPAPNFATLLYQLGVGSFMWYAAAISLPILLVIARQISGERPRRILLLAISTALVLIAATAVLTYLWTYRGAELRPPFAAYLPISLRQHALAWIALLGVVAAIEARRRSVHGQIEEERLRAEVARQRLIALAGQLHPHFLFNTLQAISTLIHRDAKAADEMLTKLSDLLRDLLRHRDSPFVRLEDEIRYARTWLEISKIRFAGRLNFEIDVPENLYDVHVPLFILQPVLENALTHGIGGALRGGTVGIRAQHSHGRLTLEVRDNGAGLPPAHLRRDGIGISNTRERLRASYGGDERLSFDAAPGGGTVVTIEIPTVTR